MGSDFSTLKLGEPYDSEYAEWRKAHCGPTGKQDLSSPIFCWWDTDTYKQFPKWKQDTVITMNETLRWSWATTRRNIIKLIGAESLPEVEQERRFDAVWPAFHWPYDSEYGKKRVEQLFNNLDFIMPPEAYKTLRENYKEDNQRRYCIMHGVRDEMCISVEGIHAGGGGAQFYAPPWALYRDKYSQPYTKRTIQEDNSFTERYPEPIRGDEFGARYTTFRLRTPPRGQGAQHLVDPGGIGNPLWTLEERRRAMDRIMPESFNEVWNEIYVTTGKIDPSCTYDECFEPKYEAGVRGPFYDDPVYGGMEPSLAGTFHPYAVPGQEVQREGGAGSTWKDKCHERGMLEKILPYAAALFGAAVPMILLPSGQARYVIAAGSAGGFYYVAQDLYGLDALLSIGDDENAQSAATWLTLGVGTGGVLLLGELNMLPQVLQDNLYEAAGGAGAGAYMLTRGRLATVLQITGGIASIITSPLTLIETGLLFMTNGCLAQEFWIPFACTCKEADKTGGKSGIRDAILADALGATGQQLRMRNKCMREAMQEGPWASTGKDLNVIGDCKGAKMENPYACFTGQNWLISEPSIFPDEPQRDDVGKQMWDLVAPCMDRNNPSFLPPKTEQDKYCHRTYGEQFRAGEGGECLDYSRPPGKQRPEHAAKPAEEADGGGCTIL